MQARHADRETCCWHWLATETRHETIVASAAADRTKANGLAVLALDGKRQLNLVDGARVIFEATDDGGIYSNSVGVACADDDLRKLAKLR